jgi:hypothetical protein
MIRLSLAPAIAAVACFCGIAMQASNAQTTNRFIVKSSVHNNATTVVDIGPAVKLPDGDEVPGRHGTVLVCNNDAPKCIMPDAGDRGFVLDRIPYGMEGYYKGPVLSVCYGDHSEGGCGVYVINESY